MKEKQGRAGAEESEGMKEERNEGSGGRERENMYLTLKLGSCKRKQLAVDEEIKKTSSKNNKQMNTKRLEEEDFLQNLSKC